jgi:hypothetical protein
VIKRIPIIASGVVWQTLCDYNWGKFKSQAYPKKLGQPSIGSDWPVAMCSMIAGQQILAETDYFEGNKYEWDRYTGKIKGEDNC